MEFFKAASKLYVNEKINSLSPSAFRVLVFSWAWAADNESDGRIPDFVLPSLGAKQKDVAELVEAGSWERNGTGHVIHDWLEHQKSKEQLEADREIWRKRQAVRRSRKSREESP